MRKCASRAITLLIILPTQHVLNQTNTNINNFRTDGRGWSSIVSADFDNFIHKEVRIRALHLEPQAI